MLAWPNVSWKDSTSRIRKRKRIRINAGSGAESLQLKRFLWQGKESEFLKSDGFYRSEKREFKDSYRQKKNTVGSQIRLSNGFFFVLTCSFLLTTDSCFLNNNY